MSTPWASGNGCIESCFAAGSGPRWRAFTWARTRRCSASRPPRSPGASSRSRILWGEAASRRLIDRLGEARRTVDAAAILQGAIAERLALAGRGSARSSLALDAARRLPGASVSAVADDLGVSERHLRRVFREAIGVSPKTFARLARFRRALGAARRDGHESWASIAAEAGYYDQAHLIAEFRVIAGVTPQGLVGELQAARSLG